QKPHIGTDVLSKIIVNIRKNLVERGVEFHFDTTMEDILVEEGKITKIITDKGDFSSDYYIFALGNSPRDTLFQLKDKIAMSNKPFAVGYRIEHPQSMIDYSQYKINSKDLPPASYQLSHSKKNQRGVYTFCMCPGGYVVNSSSEEGRLCVNGMSYHRRDGENANSAIVCGIGEEIYGTNLLDGIRFQRKIEEKAFKLGGENFFSPAQRLEDYFEDKPTTSFGKVKPTVRPGYTMTNLNGIYPKIIDDYIKDALRLMGRKIKGFDDKDAVLTGVETRTSCAVRLDRDNNMKSTGLSNLYPCGEGAGYAGGIVSSAIDGLKAAEKIIENKE
ncbi:MAG: FAD-dependent oxidoreductase, partial [Gallicola sp.]|nr:FAD-dependent oxidoreductase [Gallicola sp.]